MTNQLVWADLQFGFYYASEKAKLLNALGKRGWGTRVYLVGDNVLRFFILSHRLNEIFGLELDSFFHELGLSSCSGFKPSYDLPLDCSKEAKLITVTGGQGKVWHTDLLASADAYHAKTLDEQRAFSLQEA